MSFIFPRKYICTTIHTHWHLKCRPKLDRNLRLGPHIDRFNIVKLMTDLTESSTSMFSIRTKLYRKLITRKKERNRPVWTGPSKCLLHLSIFYSSVKIYIEPSSIREHIITMLLLLVIFIWPDNMNLSKLLVWCFSITSKCNNVNK